MNIFVYSICPFLLQPPPFPSTLLPNHMFSLKIKIKHMGVDITCFFSNSSFQFSCAMRHNDANNMTLHPLLYASFPGFRKKRRFSKKCFKCPWQHKSQTESLKEPLNLQIIVRWLFFASVVDSSRKQSQVKEAIQFEQQTEVGSIIPQIHRIHLLFSYHKLIQVIFGTEDIFCFISD